MEDVLVVPEFLIMELALLLAQVVSYQLEDLAPDAIHHVLNAAKLFLDVQDVYQALHSTQ